MNTKEDLEKMNKKLEQYLNTKEQERQSLLNREKAELLINEGLYDLLPVNANEINWNTEYVEYKWDSSTQTNRCYKQVPIEISDDEYEKIKSYFTPIKIEHKENAVAKVLTVLGCITYIIGFIGGFLGADGYFGITIAIWVASFISGTMFLAFSQIIKLLEDIKRK